MRPFERQVTADIHGIRRDHIARYEWAADQITSQRVLDIGAGIGYGRVVLGVDTTAIEIDADAISHGEKHFGANYLRRDLSASSCFYDVPWHHEATCFEVIEHLKNPLIMLERIPADVLYCSVPNEEFFPHIVEYRYHYRHYRSHEIVKLLNDAGWLVTDEMGQATHISDVDNVKGRTIVLRAIRTIPAIKSRAPLGRIITK